MDHPSRAPEPQRQKAEPEDRADGPALSPEEAARQGGLEVALDERGVPLANGLAIVLHPVLRRAEPATRRAPEARLAEAVGLAEAIGLGTVASRTIPLNRPQSGRLFGQGVIAEIAAEIESRNPDLVIIDHDLSPVQQRNLERAWGVKVIDRTGLILEIFGARARTAEGKLQVELAALSYQRSRLVRSWTHLERQRGGYGFVGGPGESQIEIDRRLIDQRLSRLRRELADVRRTRGQHRKARARVPYPVIALIGYTNAGKSTLFNRIAGADVFARDLLFATLDPTMRALELEGGHRAIFSDTVGFISDLPTHLVAAFQATLEEVQEADLICHVRDIAHPDSEAQRADVHEVLAGLGIDAQGDGRLMEVWNKADRLPASRRERLAARAGREGAALVSAREGAGMAALISALRARLTAGREEVALTLDISDGAALAWLHGHAEIRQRQDDGLVAHLTVAIDPADRARFEKRFGIATGPAPEPATVAHGAGPDARAKDARAKDETSH